MCSYRWNKQPPERDGLRRKLDYYKDPEENYLPPFLTTYLLNFLSAPFTARKTAVQIRRGDAYLNLPYRGLRSSKNTTLALLYK